jgi:histidine triad (HIT) family protein
MMKKDDCIFCKIANGEIPSATVYEDEFFRGILDIAPAAKGHVILLPKNHAADLFELPEKEASSVIPAVQKIAAAVKKATGCAGVNILQNNGECAGQTVFHFHVHVIPREKEDSIKIGWKTGTYEGDDSERTAESIRKHL